MWRSNVIRAGVWGLAALPVAVWAAVWASCAFAGPASLPEGTKTITLISAAGERLQIGDVTFTKDGDGQAFAVGLNAPEFQDEFLSMRPFPCVRGEKETWCHLAYPYEMKHRITAGDLVDLEYALLFLFKPPAGYGISTWNGLYFKLALGEDGAIDGTIHDVNLEPLGVPPADPTARLIADTDVTPADPETHRFARLEIR